MSKIAFTLVISGKPKFRKVYAPGTRVARDRTKYTRKRKHAGKDVI